MFKRFLTATFAALSAMLCTVFLTGCISRGLSPGAHSGQTPPDSSRKIAVPDAGIPDGGEPDTPDAGSTHAGQQTPAQDFAASAGNSMSGQMDNSIKGSYREDAGTGGSASAEDSTSAGNGAFTEGGSSAKSSSSAQESAPAQAAAPDVPRSGQAYLEITPAAGDFLVLVNDANRLTAGYEPPLGDIDGSEKKLHRTAAAALNKMLAAAAADGCPLHVVSGYRSVKYQQGLFERKVKSCIDAGLSAAEAETEAAGWVARPGASEHSLGLAADLVSGDWYLTHDDLTGEFAETAAYAWLVQHAAEYGFILRYPAGKEGVTGVHSEPWHWRYVGDAAPAIAESGLCLEEWLAQNG